MIKRSFTDYYVRCDFVIFYLIELSIMILEMDPSVTQKTNGKIEFQLDGPVKTDVETTVPTGNRRIKTRHPTCVSGPLAHKFRYFILILGCACLTSISSNMITLNFTLICMYPTNTSENHTLTPTERVNLEYNHPTYDFTQNQKSMLMWAVAVGSIIGTFPFNFLYAYFGARYVFFTAGMLSALSTFFIPAAAELGFWWFLIARVMQGFAYSADFAAIGVMCARWSSLKQSGMFIAIFTCFSPFSSSITNPAAGALCESSFGWPSVYYTHGGVCFFLFVLWIIFYTDHPAHHRSVSHVELEKIHRNKSEAHIKMDSFIPYWQIIKDPVVLTVWLNALADIGSGIFLVTYIPTYLKQVLNYGVGSTGILGALPAIMHIPFKLVSGYLSDAIKSVSEVRKLRIFNSVALMIPGFMYAALGYVPDEYPIIAVLLFTGIHGFLGANCGGFYKMGILIGRQYGGFIVANIQFIKCLTLFIAPTLVSIFIEDETVKEQWRNIFWILAMTLLISNAVFCYMATAEPGPYTKITRESLNMKKEEKKLLGNQNNNHNKNGKNEA